MNLIEMDIVQDSPFSRDITSNHQMISLNLNKLEESITELRLLLCIEIFENVFFEDREMIEKGKEVRY